MSDRTQEPPISDVVLMSDELTSYDREHFVTYLRLLDAEEDGADWTEVARVVLKLDPDREPLRARRAWQSHLARAKWMTARGYERLLREATANDP
jgi:T6SS, Transcription factor, DNA binding domain